MLTFPVDNNIDRGEEEHRQEERDRKGPGNENQTQRVDDWARGWLNRPGRKQFGINQVCGHLVTSLIMDG